MILRRIGVMSCGKLSGALYSVFGLVGGVIFALFSLLGAGMAASQTDQPEPLLGAVFGVGAVIIMPLFYGAMGFVMGIITAALYNFVAGWIGGIELELE